MKSKYIEFTCPKCGYRNTPLLKWIKAVSNPYQLTREHMEVECPHCGYYEDDYEEDDADFQTPEMVALRVAITGEDLTANERGLCTLCRMPLTPFADELSEREFAISGWCQACQDRLFVDLDEE